MFKYKIKVVGWEYRIYYKKCSFDLWKKTNLAYPNLTSATKAVNLLNGVDWDLIYANENELELLVNCLNKGVN